MTDPHEREAARAELAARRAATQAWERQVKEAVAADRAAERRERAAREAAAYGTVPEASDAGTTYDTHDTHDTEDTDGTDVVRPPPRAPKQGRGPVGPALGVVLGLLLFVVLHDPDRVSQLLTGAERLSPMVDVPQGEGHYAFEQRQSDGSPVSYDPCKPIKYVINPEGAPDGYLDVVTAAVEEVSKASGFEFEYDGTTDRRDYAGQSVSYLSQNPVLVMWATPTEIPALGDDVIGLGGSGSIPINGRLYYITGGIELDQDEFAGLADRHDEPEEQAVVMHELGHVLGLAHVHDDGELMNAANIGRTSFGDGDLQGLAILGRTPCA